MGKGYEDRRGDSRLKVPKTGGSTARTVKKSKAERKRETPRKRETGVRV